MSNPQINKTPGREFALKYLFQLFLKENKELKESFLSAEVDKQALEASLAEFKESYIAPDEEHPGNNLSDETYFFGCQLVLGVSKNMGSLETLLKAHSKRENLDNIENIERSILLIGAQEIIHHETPYQVIINELVELAKKYGGADSGRFINGVLDSVRTEKK